jgi:hypothetical protein
MRVSEAIKQLQELKPDEEIVIAWWDKETFFPIEEDTTVENDLWEKVCDDLEAEFDWSKTHDELDFLVSQLCFDYLKGER